MLISHLEVLLPLAVCLQGAGEMAELSCHPQLQPHQDLQGQLGVWPCWLVRGVHMHTPWLYIVGHNAHQSLFCQFLCSPLQVWFGWCVQGVHRGSSVIPAPTL